MNSQLFNRESHPINTWPGLLLCKNSNFYRSEILKIQQALSVTRWLDYFSLAVYNKRNFAQWPIFFCQRRFKSLPITKKTLHKNGQGLLRFCHFAKSLPNLVTLLHAFRSKKLKIISNTSKKSSLAQNEFIQSRQCDKIGKFWKFLTTNFISKITQMFVNFFGYFKNIPI